MSFAIKPVTGDRRYTALMTPFLNYFLSQGWRLIAITRCDWLARFLFVFLAVRRTALLQVPRSFHPYQDRAFQIPSLSTSLRLRFDILSTNPLACRWVDVPHGLFCLVSLCGLYRP